MNRISILLCLVHLSVTHSYIKYYYFFVAYVVNSRLNIRAGTCNILEDKLFISMRSGFSKQPSNEAISKQRLNDDLVLSTLCIRIIY